MLSFHTWVSCDKGHLHPYFSKYVGQKKESLIVNCLLLLNFFSLVKDFLPVICDETAYTLIKSRQPQAFQLNWLSPAVFTSPLTIIVPAVFSTSKSETPPAYVVSSSFPGISLLFTSLFQCIGALLNAFGIQVQILLHFQGYYYIGGKAYVHIQCTECHTNTQEAS